MTNFTNTITITVPKLRRRTVTGPVLPPAEATPVVAADTVTIDRATLTVLQDFALTRAWELHFTSPDAADIAVLSEAVESARLALATEVTA